jgi:hypothetical protein
MENKFNEIVESVLSEGKFDTMEISNVTDYVNDTFNAHIRAGKDWEDIMEVLAAEKYSQDDVLAMLDDKGISDKTIKNIEKDSYYFNQL